MVTRILTIDWFLLVGMRMKISINL